VRRFHSLSASISDKIWVVQDVRTPLVMMISTIYNIRVYRDTKFLNNTYLRKTVEHLLVQNSNQTFNSQQKVLLQETLLLVHYISDQLQKLETYNTSSFKRITRLKGWMALYFKATTKGRWYVDGTTGSFSLTDPWHDRSDIELLAYFNDIIRRTFTDTWCPQPVCPAGWRPNFGRLLVDHNLHTYERGFGWTCRKCPMQTIKTQSGNASCKTCPLYTISTADRTKCVDPYKILYLKPNQVETQLCVLSAIICCAVAVTMSSIFVRVRNTPIGKSVDLKLTCIQLISITSIYISFMVLYIGKPSYWKCLLRPLVISTLNDISVAIALIKIQTLLHIFNNPIKLDKHTVRASLMKRFSFIFVTVATNTALFVVTVYHRKPKVLSQRNTVKLEHEIMCDIDVHFNIATVFTILMYCAGCLQAYRGRNLPSLFYEAMTMVYMSFISVLTLSVIIPIHHFQKTGIGKMTVQWVGMATHHLAVMLLLYGKKVFIVLFKPERNTKEYFRERTFEQMQKDAILRVKSTD